MVEENKVEQRCLDVFRHYVFMNNTSKLSVNRIEEKTGSGLPLRCELWILTGITLWNGNVRIVSTGTVSKALFNHLALLRTCSVTGPLSGGRSMARHTTPRFLQLRPPNSTLLPLLRASLRLSYCPFVLLLQLFQLPNT